MNRLLRVFAIAACAACLAQADSIFTVTAPVSVYTGRSFNVDVSLSLGTGDVVQGYQLDIRFPSFLSAISIFEKGYFAANSVIGGFGFDAIDPLGTTITTIYDQLGSTDQLPSDAVSSTLFTIAFVAIGSGTGTISVAADTALLYGPLDLLPADTGYGLPIGVAFTTSDATVSAAPTPEPATWLLVAGSLLTVGARRRLAR